MVDSINEVLDKYEGSIIAALRKLYNVQIDALADIEIDGEKVSGLAADSDGIVYEFSIDGGEYSLKKADN